ncbi:MAG: CTP synthase, CTP synthase [Candidatus Peregrinibacteria bacterium GW2011_GWF2_38_29]|nr:MAG: CTP synthase, CTP synthase [Candidatus Peregrinibacteria bacterium GW2011_GWF2_38_29]HBB02639.1 CTP synthase [Candidatus Peregrinibacteria bacterium]
METGGLHEGGASRVVSVDEAKRRKYIFVIGGVCSSIGKGITAASIGRIMKSAGLKPVIEKIDPYLNIDPGTMSPLQHGEVFVTDDGAETDLDLGHYERFIDENLPKESSVSMGQVYDEVLGGERKGNYLGRTIQVIPHITDEIKRRIREVGEKSDADCVIVEIGGTIGDIEAAPILEAIRQFRCEMPEKDTAVAMVTYVPYLQAPRELKTKPTQVATRMLQQSGISPDMIFARADVPIGQDSLDKIAQFANINPENVIPVPNMEAVYETPLHLEKFGISRILREKLGLPLENVDLKQWAKVVGVLLKARRKVEVAIVGKYTDVGDSYLSVTEALKAGGAAIGRKVVVNYVDSELLEKGDDAQWKMVENAGGILVPGGFGVRGTEGKISVAEYARMRGKPYLGICLGMHVMAIEMGRKARGDSSVTSEEFDVKGLVPRDKYIIHYLPGQLDAIKGGSMRLGGYPCKVMPGTRYAQAYGMPEGGMIRERHRHRLEFNNAFSGDLEKAGAVIAGVYEDKSLVEAIEVTDHKFMVGVQYHPEFLSRPTEPHPLFAGFMKSIIS